jgi:hypothetical protein
MPAAFILSIMVSSVIAIKTWVAGRKFEIVKKNIKKYDTIL